MTLAVPSSAEAERARRASGLESMMLALRDARDVHDVLAIVARATSRVFRTSCAAYELRASALVCIAVSHGAKRPPIPRDRFDLEALRSQIVMRSGADEVLAVAGDGRFQAVLVLEDFGRTLDGDELKHLRTVGAHVSLVLASVRAFDQLRRFAAEGAALNAAARRILTHTAFEPFATAMCALAAQLVGARRVMLYGPRGGALGLLAASQAPPGDAVGAPETLPATLPEAYRALADRYPGEVPSYVRTLLPGDDFTRRGTGVLVAIRARRFEARDVRLFEAFFSLAKLAIHNIAMYEETARANARLAEANAFKDDLMAMFAHDFKGPLTVISGFAELLLETDDPVAAQSARTIIEQTRRLTKLSEDALALSATQVSEFSLERERTDAVAFVRESVAPLDRAGRIVVAASAPELPATFDAKRLRHAVDNVVGNALKYSSGPVRVSLAREGGGVRIDVADEGIGVPPAELERVFARFGRGSNARSRGISGSGVGLYIARKIVEVHGGRLEVASVENGGSTFSIFLPA